MIAAAMADRARGSLDRIKAFSETDFTEDLKKFHFPTLIVLGDDDQIVPVGASATQAAKLGRGAKLKVCPGAPHDLAATHREHFNADLLAS
jgi:non-heme chloroperoxidase